MHENISIAQLLAVIDDAAHQLKVAAGNDPFISQSDIEQLLEAAFAADTDRTYVVRSLLILAQVTEPAGGRITRSDIDRAVVIAKEQIIPAFRLMPGPLSAAAEAELYLIGIDHANLARDLKNYVLKIHQEPASPLVEQLRTLSNNLYFNTFHQNNTGIIVDSAPFGFQLVSGPTFILALENSGNRDWEEISRRLGMWNEQPGEGIADFWRTFPTLQNEGPDRERAYAIARLWRTRLSHSRFLRFDNGPDETTHFVVAGITGSSEMVFMMLRHLWT